MATICLRIRNPSNLRTEDNTLMTLICSNVLSGHLRSLSMIMYPCLSLNPVPNEWITKSREITIFCPQGTRKRRRKSDEWLTILELFFPLIPPSIIIIFTILVPRFYLLFFPLFHLVLRPRTWTRKEWTNSAAAEPVSFVPVLSFIRGYIKCCCSFEFFHSLSPFSSLLGSGLDRFRKCIESNRRRRTIPKSNCRHFHSMQSDYFLSALSFGSSSSSEFSPYSVFPRE